MRILVLFFGILTISLATKSFAAHWEVGVIFLGANENSEFQADIDQNILELARTEPDTHLKITVLRDFPTHAMIYSQEQNATSLNQTSWKPLFFKIPAKDIMIPGQILKQKRLKENSLLDSNLLNQFLHKSFSSLEANRLLIIYGHGLGPEGLKAISIKDLRQNLMSLLPKRNTKTLLDTLWLDSCFMGNIEAAYSLKDLTSFYISSEESEFSTGMPYDFLELLKNLDSPKMASMILAHRFVESYSYTSLGQQRLNRHQSPATISVLETQKLDNLITKLSDLNKNLKIDSNLEIIKEIPNTIAMEKTNLIDLGSLLNFLNQKIKKKDPAFYQTLHALRSTLEIQKPRLIKTNPRIKLVSPSPQADLVFGYNGWQTGDELDTNSQNLFPKELTEDLKFVLGPNNRNWPSRKINKRLFIVPFSVNMDEFNYYFYDPVKKQALSKSQTIVRTQDFYYFASENEDNPVVFRAYTQSIGNASEKYTGLTIQNPNIAPTMDYLETDFFKETSWTQ